MSHDVLLFVFVVYLSITSFDSLLDLTYKIEENRNIPFDWLIYNKTLAKRAMFVTYKIANRQRICVLVLSVLLPDSRLE